MIESAAAGLELVVCITEGVPVLDTVRAARFIAERGGTRLIGPNCPGVMTPDEARVGIMPSNIFRRGNVGVVSRSGTLTYEVVDLVTKAGLGVSTCVGVGGDPIIGTSQREVIEMFNADPETDAIVVIGEIGGTAEQEAAAFIKQSFAKPVVGFIAGQTAPPGRRMGHAGAIIAGGQGTAAEKMEALAAAGVHVVKSPAEMGAKMREALGR